jgi:hypothetical protein
MGFEVFINCYRRGKPEGVPRQRWIAAFGDFIHDEDTDVWLVKYDERNWCNIYVTPEPEELESIEPNTISSAMVERPCADGRFWDSLFAIMQFGNMVLYYPGGQEALSASENMAAHLPEGMADALGGIVRVNSGEQLVGYIRSH